MITISDEFEPTWVNSAAARLVWRRTLLVHIADAVGLSSAFIAHALSAGPITDSGVRKVLKGEARHDPLILHVRALLGRSDDERPFGVPSARSNRI